MNVHALNSNKKNDEGMDGMQRTFTCFMVAGGVIMAVEYAGDAMGLSESLKKGIDLTTAMGSMGWALQNRDIMEGAARLPIALATYEVASSKMFLKLLKSMPLFGEALSKMDSDQLEMLSTLALYTQIVLPVYNQARKNHINPFFGISEQ